MNTPIKQQSPANPATITAAPVLRPSILRSFANKYNVDADKIADILKATAFKVKDGVVSNEQLAALLIVASEYDLNPFTKEIYAFPDKNNGIVPVVSVDGWTRIINSNDKMTGIEFNYSDEIIEPGDANFPGLDHRAHVWIECKISRNDRAHPLVIREYFDEVYRKPIEGKGQNGPYKINTPWQTHPKRMHRHKTLIQAARLAFGFAGIYDEDEAQRIKEAIEVTPQKKTSPVSQTESAKQALKDRAAYNDINSAAGQSPAPNDDSVVNHIKQPEPVDSIPWEKNSASSSKANVTLGDDHWIALMTDCDTDAAIKLCWDAYKSHCSKNKLQPSLDVEAAMHSLLGV